MKKILVPIGIFLFAGLMLFNVSSSQNISDSKNGLAFQIEEKTANAEIEVCFQNMTACPTNDCHQKFWCPGCNKVPMQEFWGTWVCDTANEMFCCE